MKTSGSKKSAAAECRQIADANCSHHALCVPPSRYLLVDETKKNDILKCLTGAVARSEHRRQYQSQNLFHDGNKMPVDINYRTLQRILENEMHEYVVTPKVDGKRYVLILSTHTFPPHEQYAAMVDRRMDKVYLVPGVMCKNKYFQNGGTILDGELAVVMAGSQPRQRRRRLFFVFDLWAYMGKTHFDSFFEKMDILSGLVDNDYFESLIFLEKEDEELSSLRQNQRKLLCCQDKIVCAPVAAATKDEEEPPPLLLNFKRYFLLSQFRNQREVYAEYVSETFRKHNIGVDGVIFTKIDGSNATAYKYKPVPTLDLEFCFENTKQKSPRILWHLPSGCDDDVVVRENCLLQNVVSEETQIGEFSVVARTEENAGQRLVLELVKVRFDKTTPNKKRTIDYIVDMVRNGEPCRVEKLLAKHNLSFAIE